MSKTKKMVQPSNLIKVIVEALDLMVVYKYNGFAQTIFLENYNR